MDKRHFTKAAILVCVLVIAMLVCWELFLRNKGYEISYDDGPALWSDKRDKVYGSNTVFIGSSRIKYDLDIETWKKITGEDAVQLAMEGTSPRPILDDLANDKNFKGRLIIDVTEVLFFGKSPGRQAEVKANLDFYKDHHTPAQKAGFFLNKHLESHFVFLDKETFSLTAKLSEIKLPQRKSVSSPPYFPLEFRRVTFERQSFMTPLFLQDTGLQNMVKKIWEGGAARREPPPKGDTLEKIFLSVKKSIDKIKARGGQVIFVRTPSSGPFLEKEQKGFPREKYWEKLLQFTNCAGIHFMDSPETSGYQCPEFSHLSITDAKHYTTQLSQKLFLMNWFSANKTIAKLN